MTKIPFLPETPNDKIIVRYSRNRGMLTEPKAINGFVHLPTEAKIIDHKNYHVLRSGGGFIEAIYVVVRRSQLDKLPESIHPNRFTNEV